MFKVTDKGYITPGHGVRGKLVVLVNDSDLATMKAL